MKRLILLFFLFGLLKPLHSQDYFVGFFGERPNLSAPSYVGHAFIGIGKGTPVTRK